jgi:hypothetical protein
MFNESEVLVQVAPDVGTLADMIRVWYNDENALLLGVSKVRVRASAQGGFQEKAFPTATMTGSPAAHALDPTVGATDLDGPYAGTDGSSCAGHPDLCDRPIFPSLFITDITADPTSRAGDWQSGGKAVPAHEIFGSWKTATRTVDMTRSPPIVSLNVDSNPDRNHWQLSGGDAPSPAILDAGVHLDQGYGTELRWSVSRLGLARGHAYRVQVMVHDGDQNRAGGDAGEACVFIHAQ